MHRQKSNITVYLNSVEGDIVHVVHHAQQTVGEANKGTSQQEDKVILVQTHMRGNVTEENKKSQSDFYKKQRVPKLLVLFDICLPITLLTWVAKCLISGPDGNGTTPSHNYSHQTVNQGADKLTRVQQLTQ